MTNYHVRDAGDPRKYYTQIPNIVDDTQMSVYAFRLYVHLKRVAGDDGKCWQSTQTLAQACSMSMGKISYAKQELKDLKLITIKKVIDKAGNHDEIETVDIWRENMLKYNPLFYDDYTKDEGGSSPHEKGSSQDEDGFSPHETKNNPVKNNPKIKEEEARPAFSEGQSYILQALGAKRFANTIQAQTILEMERSYGFDVFKQGVDWAATNGMKLGHAVNSLKTALPKWGQPKTNGRNGNGYHAPAAPPTENAFDRLRKKREAANAR